MCLDFDLMYALCALEETVFYMCMNEQLLTGANPERNARVHVCVLHECAFVCAYSYIHYITLFTLAAQKKHICMLVVFRLMVCEWYC